MLTIVNEGEDRGWPVVTIKYSYVVTIGTDCQYFVVTVSPFRATPAICS